MGEYGLERFVAGLTALGGVFLLGLSLYSLYLDYISFKPVYYLVIDMAFVVLSSILIGGGLKLGKRITAYRTAATATFDEFVYQRLKPVLEEVALGVVELNEVKSRIARMERMLSELHSGVTKPLEVEHPVVSESLAFRKTAFYMKTIVVTLFFLGAYMFFLQYRLRYEEYLYPLLYIIWWVFITKEFELYRKTEAWVALAIPVLLVPTGSIILGVVFGVITQMGVIFVTVTLYAIAYYYYAKELSHGKGGLTNGYVEENFMVSKMKSFVRELKEWFR